MFLIDAHQDLAWNMLTFGRDYSLSAEEIRQSEKGGEAPAFTGDTLLGWPEFQKGQVAVIFASLFAAPIRRKQGKWERLCYANINEAVTSYNQQLDCYHQLTEDHPDKFNLILTRDNLENVIVPMGK
jgi:membrane dipeptidase